MRADDEVFDDVLSAVGFGKWQAPALLVTILAMSQFSVHLLGSPLLSAPLPFRCLQHLPTPNASTETFATSLRSHYDSQCLDTSTTQQVLRGVPTNGFLHNDTAPARAMVDPTSVSYLVDDSTRQPHTRSHVNSTSLPNSTLDQSDLSLNIYSTANSPFNRNAVTDFTSNPSRNSTVKTISELQKTNKSDDLISLIFDNIANTSHDLSYVVNDSTDLIDDAFAQSDSDIENMTVIFHVTGLPSCPFVAYDRSVFTSTIISEWHLLCDNAHLRPAFQSVFTVGGMFGCTAGGTLGDRCGRRLAVQMMLAVNLVAVAAMAAAPLYPLVLICRFLSGCCVMGMLVPAWSLCLEATPIRQRSHVGMLLGLPFSVSTILLATVGYFIRSWRWLLLACSSPMIVLLPVFLVADESPRWLVQKGKMEEARKVLQKAAKLNGAQLAVPLNSLLDNLLQVSIVEERKLGWKSQFVTSVRQALAYLRSPAMRIILMVTPVIWFLQSCLYLGVVINANNFTSSDPFLYVGLSGVMEGCAIIAITPFTAHLGRRFMVWAALTVGGILLLLELLVPGEGEWYWLKWILVMTGFLLVAGSFQVNYLYAPELFPTEARARGFAFVNLSGSIGFSCAPLITDILAQYAWWAVGVTLGTAGILGGFLVPFLPETKNTTLPDTLQDVEYRHKNRKAVGKRSPALESGMHLVSETSHRPLSEVSDRSLTETTQTPLSETSQMPMAGIAEIVLLEDQDGNSSETTKKYSQMNNMNHKSLPSIRDDAADPESEKIHNSLIERTNCRPTERPASESNHSPILQTKESPSIESIQTLQKESSNGLSSHSSQMPESSEVPLTDSNCSNSIAGSENCQTSSGNGTASHHGTGSNDQ